MIHAANAWSVANGKAYKCENVTEARLVAGAINYNGGGNAQYGVKIKAAILLFGWPV